MINDPIMKTKPIRFRFRNEYSSTTTALRGFMALTAANLPIRTFLNSHLYFRALTGKLGAQITIATSNPPWIRNNSTKADQVSRLYFKVMSFTSFVEQFYNYYYYYYYYYLLQLRCCPVTVHAIKVQIQGIIVSLIATIIHNENNALCSHRVQTCPMNLVTNKDCFPKQQ